METFSRSDILVVFALPSEAQHAFDDFNVVFCGVGKVNATYHLMRTLNEWRIKNGRNPTLVLNLGSAGSGEFKRHAIINATHFYERDMNATAFGFPLYHTPGDETPICLDNGLRFDAFPQGTCGTGDSFETAHGGHQWNLVDMESYALAKVCYREKVPFASLKHITDGGDTGAADDWTESVQRTAEELRKAVNLVFP